MTCDDQLPAILVQTPPDDARHKLVLLILSAQLLLASHILTPQLVQTQAALLPLLPLTILPLLFMPGWRAGCFGALGGICLLPLVSRYAKL